MTANQILSISPQGQITLPIAWRKAFKLGKNQKIIASLKQIKNVSVLTFIPEPKSWTEFSAGLGESLWKNIDIDKFIAKERDSWK